MADRDWRDRVVSATESLLTWRNRRRSTRREKQKQKNQIVDWIEAFVWAACVVLLINQYLLQAYQIPSGSMIDTLLEQDRIFVNKLVYGPELLPGLFKMPGFAEPQRNEVVIFENPSYIGRGTAFNILQRVIYMITLSMVDIDRDEFGQPRAHFLIKRAVGVDHDRFRARDGVIEILPRGESSWMTEAEFQQLAGIEYRLRRIVDPLDYPLFSEAGREIALQDLSLSTDGNALRRLQGFSFPDSYHIDTVRTGTLYAAQPHNRRLAARNAVFERGWYIPENRMLLLGDNRDNSRDGRHFGPVHSNRVLGRAMFKYWPIARIGRIL
ncbi:MAG: signal peptidase I [Spirochaetaceae bacterium]|nr:MAG: signal peptidase I [Spirochaetaceae bacterium]